LDSGEELVGRIASGIRAGTGERYWEETAEQVAGVLGAACVWIGELVNSEPPRVDTLAFHGNLTADFQIETNGLWRPLLEGKRISDKAPDRARLGTPLISSKGAVLGLMTAEFCCPPAKLELAAATLEIFASRASSELERRSTEAALQWIERRYADVISQSSEGVWRIELIPPIPIDLPTEEFVDLFFERATIAEANDAMAQLLGYSAPEALLGRRIGDIEEIAGRRFQLASSLRRGFHPQVLAFRATDRNGTVRWLERHQVPIVEDGKLVRSWDTTRDVTKRHLAEEELRQSEARYRALFETAGDAIFTIRDGAIQDCNGRSLELFGGSRAQILGRTPWDLSPEFQPDGQDSREKALSLLAAGESERPERFEWQHRRIDDGTLFDASVTLTSLVMAGVHHHLALVRDITEKKHRERQIEAWNERLEEVVAERTSQLEAARQELEAF
jgi:PAS domain S-box-containing protein